MNAFLARFKCFAKMFLKIKLRIFLQTKAPTETVEYVRRYLIDSNRTCSFAFGLAAHSVSDDQELALGAAVNASFIVELEACRVHSQRLIQIRDEKMIFVRRSLSADVP
jgi:hypothetical protein